MSGARKPKAKPRMSLKEALEQYIASRPGLAASTATQYRLSLLAFSRFLERPGTLADLNEEMIAGFVASRLDQVMPKTVHRNRGDMLVLWRFAARKSWTKPPPLDSVAPVKIPRRMATAWTLEQIEKMLSVCSTLSGRVRGETDKQVRHRHLEMFNHGPERAHWWVSLIFFLYDTGTRISAALSITPSDIDLERGLVTLRAESSKTNQEQVLRLAPQTVAAIRQIYDLKAKRVWPWRYHRRQVWYQFGKILEAAGLPNDHTRKFHAFRRTTATFCAAAGRRDLAQSTLGHATATMTNGYIDGRQLPIQSAADVLPRPTCAVAPAPLVSEQKPDPTAAMLSTLSPQQLEMVVGLAKALFGVNVGVSQ